jgi:hypothetical protein
MTSELLVYDIFEIKSLLEDDHDIDQLWVLSKYNSYRAIFINQEYAVKAEIKPVWLQRLHKQNVEKVTSADDPNIVLSSISVGKVVLPSLVALPDDLGLYRVSGSSGIIQFDPMEFNTMMMKIDIGEERNGQYGYCARIGNNLYLYPNPMEIQALVIAENPFDVQINDAGTLRTMLVTDEYPMERDMAQKIALEILTKDLALNDKAITDIINDSQSQLKLLKGGGLRGNSQQSAD